MINAVGRDIPEALLVNGKEVYQGKNYMDGKYLQKAAPKTRRFEKPQESKIVATLVDALKQCGAKANSFVLYGESIPTQLPPPSA